MVFFFHLPVEAEEPVACVNARSLPEADQFFLPRQVSLHARNNITTGGWDARLKSGKILLLRFLKQ